jgi:hypothetical protein
MIANLPIGEEKGGFCGNLCLGDFVELFRILIVFAGGSFFFCGDPKSSPERKN